MIRESSLSLRKSENHALLIVSPFNLYHTDCMVHTAHVVIKSSIFSCTFTISWDERWELINSMHSHWFFGIIINTFNIKAPFLLKFTPTTFMAMFKTILVLSGHLSSLYSIINALDYDFPLYMPFRRFLLMRGLITCFG